MGDVSEVSTREREDETAEAWLVAEDGRSWPLQANCPIGRSPSNQIVLSDRKVSRRHAIIHRQDGHEFWLVDLGSGNGSYINELRVSLPARLQDGDVMKLGDFALRFRQKSGLAAAEPRSQIPSVTYIEVRNTVCWMLLADIVGSTHLAAEHEPEAWASLVGHWAADCRNIIEMHGGAINKYLGDGFLAIWPAREGDAERLCRALGLLNQLQLRAAPPFRLALHRGEVCTGGGCSLGEDNLSGLELVMLFRMEKLAGRLKKSFLCSAAAAQALNGRVQLASAGHHPVEGFADTEPREFFRLAGGGA